MRRLAVALIAALAVALVALTLAGCGGGEAAQPAAEDPAAASATATPTAASEPASGTVFEPFPVLETMPPEVKKNLDANEPMILFFYDGSQKVSTDIRKQVQAALDDDEAATLVQFDLGEYSAVDENGTINVDAEALDEDPDAQAAVQLALAAGVTAAPTLVFTDTQNYIIYRQQGLMDSAMVGRQLDRVDP